MFKYLDERYVEFFVKSLRLSGLAVEFSKDSKKNCREIILVSRETKPNLVFLNLENRKFLVNAANYCHKSIKFYLLNYILKQKILEKISNERKL
ncbi:MAG: hypothetical protein ACK4GJ_03510 [bacterium]